MIDTIACPHCGRQLRLPPECRAAELQCPGCGQCFSLGQATAAATPPGVVAGPLDESPDDEQPSRPSLRARQTVEQRTGGRPARAAARATATRQRWTRRLVILGALVVGVPALALCVLVANYEPEPEPQRVDVRPREHIVDLEGQPPDDGKEDKGPAVFDHDPALEEELQKFFASLGAALLAQDGVKLARHFDAQRLVDLLVTQKTLRLISGRDSAVRELSREVPLALVAQAPLLAWDRTDLRRVRRLSANEVYVVARHRSVNGGFIRMRWWLLRHSGLWHLYDLEDVYLAQRMSTAAALVLAKGLPNLPAVQASALALNEAWVTLVLQNDVNGAERKLQEIALRQLPAPFEARRWLAQGLIRLNRDQPKEALEAFNQAEILRRDMPILAVLRAVAHNRLQHWEQARQQLQTYHERFGDEATTNRELGEALRNLHRVEEAREAYRKCLDEDPKNVEALVGLLFTLTPDSNEILPDLAERFRHLDVPRLHFERLFDDCRQVRDWASLEQLALAMREIDAGFAPAHFALALTYASAERAAEASAAFRMALSLERDDGKRRARTDAFLQAMAESGFAAQAYAAAPERRPAFRVLTAELQQKYRLDELRPLVAAHALADPDDPLLPWYQGEVHVQAGRFALAEQAFAAGLAKAPEPALVAQFRASRVLARYRTGQALAAYRELGPVAQTFHQLVNLAGADGNDALLQELVAAHAKAHPADPELPRLQIGLCVRQNQLDAAVAVFRAAAAKQEKPELRQQVLNDFLYALLEADKPLEAYRAVAEPRAAFAFLARQLASRRDFAALRQLLDAHRQHHGDDPALLLHTAGLYAAEGQRDQAVAAYAKLWPRLSEQERELQRYNYLRALVEAGRGLDAYEQLTPRSAIFPQLARLLLQKKKTADLHALLKRHQQAANDGPEFLYFLTRALILAKEPADAQAAWRSACAAQTNPAQRRYYVADILGAMYEAGDGLAGYRVAPDQKVAFETLAPRLVADRKPAELATLLKEATLPPALRSMYEGELALLRGEFAAAERLLAKAERTVPLAQRWQCRAALNQTRIRAGKVLDAYRAAPSLRRFADLAYTCVNEKNPAQLQALLTAHGQADPDDPNLPSWEVELKLLAKDYPAAVTLLLKQRETLARNPHLGGSYASHLVRSLVKLERYADAQREAATATRGPYDQGRLLQVYAHVAAGQVPQALAVVERAPRQQVLLQSCYRDPDLGPLLRSDALRSFRERYPEPALPTDDGFDD